MRTFNVLLIFSQATTILCCAFPFLSAYGGAINGALAEAQAREDVDVRTVRTMYYPILWGQTII